MEDENKSLIESPSVAPLVVAAGSKFLLEELGATAVGAAVTASPVLVGTLLAAGAFYVGKLLAKDDSKSTDGKILETLQRTSLDVRIADDGQMSTTVCTATETSATVKVDQQVTVENRQGTTTVHIDNLTINLNAEMVQQLNMNPKEVINQLTEQIQQTSLKALADRT